ncbi:DNA cytosine methyltransferase [Hyphomonas oceanitis]|uniref:Cytosine-specific methyltransferase n=1 Tax=Hyphomonas oceanitis SCH89 TaxID=1280953 RepID=A0A059G1I8_9PROT|nr:DNA (cytosine-5-)-methyltransferase [Hyphomonas oceanitis]KDA00732.1 DNA-cytosine methyltransferase [Hyphomonas oceanitis SCH89]|tara:strand:+ start:3805 stop:5028 length:1224 start_codon:yes stop_codon:yes gene_type:complete
MLKAISLFSGIGGLDFGFEAAGFETRVALELDPRACSTIRLNRPWPVLEADINDISSKKILETAGLKKGEADILFGGPPCQPFSKSSYWVRGDSLRLDDPRADTLTGYLRVLRDTQPKTFLLENVAGLAFKNKDEGLRLILESIETINHEIGTNYKPVWKSLNCVDFGVPQRRERIFIVGARDGQEFKFPEPTHRDPQISDDDLFSTQLPYTTAWDALHDIDEPTELSGLIVGGKWGDLLPTIPEGNNYLWHTNRNEGEPLFGWRTRYWSFLLKLSKRLPSWTIQAQPGSAIGPFHWNNRRLTFEEMCRLQTFPDGLRVQTGRTEMQRMLGNAVPSLMAETLAREIRRQLLRTPLNSKRILLPPNQTAVPAPKRTTKVPDKYKSMLGDHADHPGTGKGSKALKRSAA